MAYELLKFVHIVGACVLLGTGAGIAFFMLWAHRTGDAVFVAATANTVVVADFVFTASAVFVQPVSGVFLAWEAGWSLWEGWILLSLGLYIFVGCFWLPVVWIQLRMKDLAAAAVKEGKALPPAYHSLFRIWFICGFPAFFAVLAIVWLMITRPGVSLGL